MNINKTRVIKTIIYILAITGLLMALLPLAPANDFFWHAVLPWERETIAVVASSFLLMYGLILGFANRALCKLLVSRVSFLCGSITCIVFDLIYLIYTHKKYGGFYFVIVNLLALLLPIRARYRKLRGK